MFAFFVKLMRKARRAKPIDLNWRDAD